MNLSVEKIIRRLPVSRIIGDEKSVVNRVVNATSEKFSPDDLLWVSDKNLSLLKKIDSGVVILSEKAAHEELRPGCTYLVVSNPRLYFMNVLKTFFLEEENSSISQKAEIHPSVRLGRNVHIAPGVVIEADCVLGDDTRIDSNTVIKLKTIIGKNVRIGANNTIGGVGFGYEKNEHGEYEVLPHIGNVVIEDAVEIGNNTAVDRGVIGSTILRRNCKIDNLVHIAHGVEIGENALIIANAMVAGSTIVGKNVWVAPSAPILNKLRVGDNAVVGMGAVVLKDVSASQTVVGNPAKDLSSLKKS